jgi:hypothetical protein
MKIWRYIGIKPAEKQLKSVAAMKIIGVACEKRKAA